MLKARVIAPDDDFLSEDQINDTLHKAFDGVLNNQKVLVLIPDHTRTLPLPFLFNSLNTPKR